MSEHQANLKWERTTPDFVYDSYDRTHEITFPGGIRIQSSSAPEFFGKKELVNPEEAFVASLSSCHMLTFLAIAARKRVTVNSYEDTAIGHLQKGESGKLWMAKVHLHPQVDFADPAPSAEKILEMHQKAHENCFIALSVKTEVVVEPKL